MSIRLLSLAAALQLFSLFAMPSAADAQEAKALDREALVRMLMGDDPRRIREAAEAVQKSPPKDKEELSKLADAVKSALSSTRDSKAEVALRLALGKLAAAGAKDAADWSLETVEWGFESMSVTHRPSTPPEVFDAHVIALEMVPGAAKELMIGNLEVALNFPDAELKERQRLKEFVTLTAEAMRTRELADFLNELLTSDDDLFVKIEAPLEARLIACYQRVKAAEPINADAVVQWLEKHPGSPPEVEIAALETLSLVGTTKPDAVSNLADRLLAKPETAVVVARRLIAGHLDKGLAPRIKAALAKYASTSTEASDLLRKLP
jgi:hypothetical protein